MEENVQVEKLIKLLKDINIEDLSSFYISDFDLKKDHGIDLFKSFLFQGVRRNIEGKDLYFLEIKDINLKPFYRGKKIFSRILDELEFKKFPIFIDDILNYRLFSFLYKKKYKNLKYQSSYGWKRCMYKLN